MEEILNRLKCLRPPQTISFQIVGTLREVEMLPCLCPLADNFALHLLRSRVAISLALAYNGFDDSMQLATWPSCELSEPCRHVEVLQHGDVSQTHM